MTDQIDLDEYLSDLAESGRRQAVPVAASHIRARGERRARRRRAAMASGGTLLAVVLAVGGLSVVRAAQETERPAEDPTPTASMFAPPTPAEGQEYASELGYVYGAVARGEGVQVSVEQLSAVGGTTEPTGVVHTLLLSPATLVESRELAGGSAGDVRLGNVVDQLAGGPGLVFAIDYDGDGHVQSLREVDWLDG